MHLDRIPPERRFLSNPAHASLAVGAALLDGELAYHKGRQDEAYRQLRRAVKLDDNLFYTEPWAWMHPPRHALAALLLDQGQVSEAEQVYRDDLGLSGAVQRCAQHPDNVWALHGLAECLTRRGEPDELPRTRDRLAAPPWPRQTYPSARPACAGRACSSPPGVAAQRRRTPMRQPQSEREPPLGAQLLLAWPILGRLHNCHPVHLLMVWVWRSSRVETGPGAGIGCYWTRALARR